MVEAPSWNGIACFTEARSDDRQPGAIPDLLTLTERPSFLCPSRPGALGEHDRSPSSVAALRLTATTRPRLIAGRHPLCCSGICWASEPRGWGGLSSPQASSLFVRSLGRPPQQGPPDRWPDSAVKCCVGPVRALEGPYKYRRGA